MTAAPARPVWRRVTLLFAILLAYLLRTVTLDLQSLWSDEGISLLRSRAPLAELLAEMPVEHLPGYFVGLHFWLKGSGETDFALRYFSLMPSVLAVPVLFALAIRFGRFGSRLNRSSMVEQVALTAALLLATNGFQIWYAQEARMYSWLLLGSLLSHLFLVRLLAADAVHKRLDVAGYILALTATVYLHFYGFLVPATHTVFVALWFARSRDRRALLRWAGAGLGVVLLFLPWAPRAFAVQSFPGWRDPLNPAAIPWRYFVAYTVGDAMPTPWSASLPYVYLLLLLLGVAAWRRLQPSASGFLTLALFVPLGIVIALAYRNPDFHERYAIMSTVPLLLLIGAGVQALNPMFWRRDGAGSRFFHHLTPAITIGLLLAFNALAYQRAQSDTALHKPDFRGAAWRIMQEERPGDVILVDGPDPEKVFLHYYSGENPVHDLRFLLDADGEEVDAALQIATQGAQNVWEVLYFHAPGPVQVWTATRGWASAPSDHNDIRVTRYGLPGPTLERTALDLQVGAGLRLESAEVSAAPLHAGDLLQVSTHWFVEQALPAYKFSLRLQDGAGAVQLARDYIPQNGFAPTEVWLVGRPATDQRGVIIPPHLASGTYTVTLRLYTPETGEPLNTEAGQDIPLGVVELRME